MNNRHWFSDVVAGAGFGILSAELGYMLLPVINKTFNFNPKENKSFRFTSVLGDYTGLGLPILSDSCGLPD